MTVSAQPKEHQCGDSRLTCADCSKQVCPQCFVPCPVGNRCKDCAGAVKPIASPTKTLPASSSLKQLIACALFGVMFAWVDLNVGLSYLAYVFYFAFLIAGRECGQRIRRDRNDRQRLNALISFGSGMVLGSAVILLLAGAERNEFLTAMIFPALNAGLMGIGFLIGRCGFG